MKTNLVPSLFHLSRARARVLALCAIAFALMAAGDLRAQNTNAPPERLSYQGYLVDANGNPLAPSTPANYTIVFRIWTASSGGSLLWTEQQVVTVDKGNFSVVLGEGTTVGSEARPPLSAILANNANASDRYVGITVTINNIATDILPRLRLLATPYAFLATSARNLTSPTGANLVTYTNSRVEIAGNVAVAGTISGAFAGSGASITNIPASSLPTNFPGQRTFDGPVGIGTTTPIDLLQVGSFGRTNTALTIATAGGNQFRSSLKLRHFNDTWGWTLDSDERDNMFRIIAHSADFVGAARLSLTRGGNLGIGNFTPGFPLSFADTLGDKISLWGQSGNHFGFGIQGSLLQIHSDTTNSDIAFGAGRSAAMTEVMRVKGTGRVGIGTTTPVAALDVRGNIALGTNGQQFATSAQEVLRIVRGVVGADATIRSGSGFTVVRAGPGRIDVTPAAVFGSLPAITVTSYRPGVIAAIRSISANHMFTVDLLDRNGLAVDSDFAFIMIGTR